MQSNKIFQEASFIDDIEGTQYATKLSDILIVVQKKIGKLLDNADQGYVVHHKQSIIYANELASIFLGKKPNELIGRHIIDFIPDERVDTWLDRFNRLFIDEEEFHNDNVELIGAYGENHLVDLTAGPFPWAKGSLAQFIIQDASSRGQKTHKNDCSNGQQKRDNQLTAQQVTMLLDAQRISKTGNWYWDLNNDEVVYSGNLSITLGIELGNKSIHLSDFLENVHIDDIEKVRQFHLGLKMYSLSGYLDYRIVDPKKGIVWVREEVHEIVDGDGKLVALKGTIQDVTQLKKKESQIWEQAHIDKVTSLPNRFFLNLKLKEMLRQAEEQSSRVALVKIRIDSFELIKDALGLEFANGLLELVSKRIKSCLRSNETIGRLDAFEFLIMLSDTGTLKRERKIKEQLDAIFLSPFLYNQKHLNLTTSIGVVYYPEHGHNSNTLMRNIDVALTQLKGKAENSHITYHPSMSEEIERRLALENALWHSIENEELEVYLQSQVDLTSGRIIGAEALLRWHSAEFGDISPVDFIPIAEATGTIIPIGHFVIKQACEIASKCHQIGTVDCRIAINISPVQFKDISLFDFIGTEIKRCQIFPNDLDIEITEGVLIDPYANAEVILQKMRHYGIHLSIDDFGTGYSSLSYLRRMHFNTLKIDKSFVNDLGRDADTDVIVDSIITMSKRLGIDVIAEGIETIEQLKYLQSLGCDKGQGYFFARPLPVNDFFKHLSEHV